MVVAISRARASIVEPLPKGPSNRLLLEQGFDVLEADAKVALALKAPALPHLTPWRKSRLRSLALNNLLATEPRIVDPAPRADGLSWRRRTPELLAPRRLVLVEGPRAQELGVVLALGVKEPEDLERLFAVVWQLSVSEASDQAREVVEIFADSVRRFRGPDTARWTRLAIQEQHRIYTDVGDRRSAPAFQRATAFVGAAFEVLPDHIDALVMAGAHAQAGAALKWYREHLPNMNQWLTESESTSGLHPRDVELTLLASEARVARAFASSNRSHAAMASAMAATQTHDEITRVHLDETGEHPIDRVRSLQLVVQTALGVAALTNDRPERMRALKVAVKARVEREELVAALRLPVPGNKRAEFKHAARFTMLDHALGRAIGDKTLAWSTQNDAVALAAAHEGSFPVMSRALRRLSL